MGQNPVLNERRPLLRPCAWGLSLLALPSIAFGWPQQEHARLIQFDIPPGSLSTVLVEFAEQSELELLDSQSRLAGARSSGLRGRFSAADALDRVLRCTGFEGGVRRRVVRVWPMRMTQLSTTSGLALEACSLQHGAPALAGHISQRRPALALAAQALRTPAFGDATEGTTLALTAATAFARSLTLVFPRERQRRLTARAQRRLISARPVAPRSGAQ